MKPKIILMAAVMIMILTTTFITVMPKSDQRRVHQHREDTVQKCVHQNEVFCTHLPIVNISTGGQKIPGEPILNELGNTIALETGDNGETMIIAEISVIDNARANNHIGDTKAVDASAWLRIRGNSSRIFDKKSYAIRFIDTHGYDRELAVMGMPAHDEWALYGPFLDKTLLRNYLGMNISAEVMGYAPNVRFCECFLDGRYQGVYLFMETVARSENRVNLTGYDPDHVASSYIVRMDEYEHNERSLDNFTYYTLNNKYNTGFTIVYPPRLLMTPETRTFIEDDISQFEKALYSFDFKDPARGYRAYIDVDSFVDYYVLQEFFLNNDMCSRSTFLYKDIRGKLHMGPVWDYNNAFNNFIPLDFDGTDLQFIDRTWYQMLLRDEYFVNKVIARYKALRKSYLSDEYLLNYIDETTNYLGGAIDRNYMVWGYTFEREHQKPGVSRRPIELNPTSYEEAIDQLKTIIVKRGEWMDKHIDILQQNCHGSKIKHFLPLP
ncbi:MAG TPA: CotH kinase family protein [Syntrophomonas sp.]|nr:CotH kinase family protein [Syntrophomonas sp.]HRW12277.1 CotH kinase family protein [Syntrophomonas sp.]